MRESFLEKKFTEELRKLNCLAWKFTSPGTVGVPDRIVITPKGETIFVELKAPGKQLREIQKYRKRQLERQNVRVEVIDTPKKLEEFLIEIQTP